MIWKRFISILLVIATLLTISAACLAAGSYWTWQDDWNSIKSSGNGDAIIAHVHELVTDVYPEPTTADEYMRLADPVERAAVEYERKGMYTEACAYYKKALACYTWLHENGLADYTDKLMVLEALTVHLKGYFEVYAETAEPTDVPYYGAINEPEKGTYYGFCDEWLDGNQSAKLIYVHFFDEEISSYDRHFPEDAENSIVELAWNIPNETKAELDAIASGDWDAYIIRNLQYLAGKDHKILLRFGAEVNTWSDLPQNAADAAAKGDAFCQSYIAAFRKIASLTHQYAPNCAMVYSPNDISNWYFDIEDFYPGDAYVDWVGMSSYGNITHADGSVGNGVDAWYSRGNYENQIIRIKDIVDTFGDRKPIMISECGFAYNSYDNIQTQAHAQAAMQYFYTYVNMVYPQVKAVFYFNTNYAGGGNYYQLTGNNGNAEMLRCYQAATSRNASMQATVDPDNAAYYTKLENFTGTGDQLKLTVFSYFPGSKKTTVTFNVDGKEAYETDQYPYSYITDALGVGVHDLSITAACGDEIITEEHTVYVGADGRISSTVAEMTDLSKNWSYNAIAYCLHNGIFNGMTATTFEPKSPVSRAMFVTVLGRIAGVDTSRYKSGNGGFTDVQTGRWYTPYVLWAKENGIVNGITDTTFAPNADITREQMCAILVRFCNTYDIELKPADGSVFADDADISKFAKSSVYIAKASGLVNGKGDNMFVPKANASREEAAMILMRFKSNIFDAK